MSNKPNIVFIMADQLGAAFLGCYGSGVNSTPTLDKLAKNGMMFNRHYTNSSVCAPNRASILTGRSQVVHGITINCVALQSDTPTYADILKENGYKTGGFGKFHITPFVNPPTSLSYLGFDEVVISEDPKWGPWIDWVREKYPDYLDVAISVTCGHSGTRGTFRIGEKLHGATDEELDIKEIAFEKYVNPLMKSSPWERMYPSPLPPEVHDTTFITEKALEFMDKHKNDKEPFLCYISYVDPHDPYDPPKPYDTMFDPNDMTEPALPEWIEQGPECLENVRDNYLNFRQICDDNQAIKKFRALYHGSLKFIDDQIARVVEFLEKDNLLENTIIIFTTDHGDLVGDHGLVGKLDVQYDACIRCPLIISGNGISKGIYDNLSCSLDIMPTICELAGVDNMTIPPVEGYSLSDICNGNTSKKVWNEILCSIYDCDSLITDDGFRLTHYNDEWQMFDVLKDKNEQNNLYNNTDYTSKRIELYERMIYSHMKARLVPQYRNLPVKNGIKYTPTYPEVHYTYYNLPPCPWLTDEIKPEWRGGINKCI